MQLPPLPRRSNTGNPADFPIKLLASFPNNGMNNAVAVASSAWTADSFQFEGNPPPVQFSNHRFSVTISFSGGVLCYFNHFFGQFHECFKKVIGFFPGEWFCSRFEGNRDGFSEWKRVAEVIKCHFEGLLNHYSILVSILRPPAKKLNRPPPPYSNRYTRPKCVTRPSLR